VGLTTSGVVEQYFARIRDRPHESDQPQNGAESNACDCVRNQVWDAIDKVICREREGKEGWGERDEKATREKGKEGRKKKKRLNNHERQEGGVERVSRTRKGEGPFGPWEGERTILTPGGKRRRTRSERRKISVPRLEGPGGGRTRDSLAVLDPTARKEGCREEQLRRDNIIYY
jgi:hypothetical protein